ncbi:MAG: hypothetical protein JWN44_4064 [Myxococcales bacterium]|nr:hypothetical protein [Myxococcales bacterium]
MEETQTETDLTAVIIPSGQLSVEEVHRIVVESGRHAALVRVAPLPKLNLVQIEVHDPRRGLPTEDPALVGLFSKGGRATFVHVNHSAKQAMVHGFIDGRPNEGFAGAPGDDFLARLRVEAGVDLASLVAADDGTRIGIGVASSHTVALIRGRALVLPIGTPTGLDGFTFHDRGTAIDEGAERLAWFAFDRTRAFGQPGKAMAALIGSAPAGALGPLEGAREEAIAALEALGDRTPAEAKLASPRALELCAYAAAMAWTGGDQASYWDGRVLPMFVICGRDTPIAAVLDASEAEELDDETESLIEAMVETLPFPAPPDGEGPMLTQLAAAEVQPLAPWAQAGEEHAGSVFMLRPERLLSLVRSLDGPRLGKAAESFARAWYRALRPGQPEGDAYQQWRVAKEHEGEKDLERFVNDWAELRACLEVAAANRLDVALMFYA